MSSEVCPLAETGIYWTNRGEIPDACRSRCEEIWNNKINSQAGEIDEFSRDCDDSEPCTHDIETGDFALQRIDDERRLVGVLNVCAWTGDELYAEEYVFICPAAGPAPTLYPEID